MHKTLDFNNIDDYRFFIAAKALPTFRCVGREIYLADEYASRLGMSEASPKQVVAYEPLAGLFDYQRDMSRLAILKKKFALFVECGRGKTLCMLEWIRYVSGVLPTNKKLLIISPLMVIRQTLAECKRWYGDSLPLEQVHANGLVAWLGGAGGRIGITNYEALRGPLDNKNLGALALDESSMLKSHYGKWGGVCLQLGAGLEYKLAMTGTPAPNDRIEYANHALFLDAFPTVNSFLAKYFVNKGQTQERWILKPHALTSFYRDLSHWCIFLTNPATYGWKDNCDTIPSINVHIQDVDLTKAQQDAVYQITGKLFVDNLGGIVSRSKLSQVSKGKFADKNVETLKPKFIKQLVESWPDESTIIWCHFNEEQTHLEKVFPDAVSVSGNTPHAKRERMIADFQSGKVKVLITKPKVLGFGLNLQIATRQIFSGIKDSFEEFHQAVKRSNRVGSTLPLNVHIPVTEVERPMIENVLRKAHRVQEDTEIQEKLFKERGVTQWYC